MSNKSLVFRLTRDLHLYSGLFISPFILVFAVSVIFLNHAWLPWGGSGEEVRSRQRVSVHVPAEANSLDLAKQVRQQIGLSGEIGYVGHDQKSNTLHFPLEKPGWRATVDVNLGTGNATIIQRETGVWDAMVYLHKTPGPHNVAIRGNWVITKIWGALADATVYLVLFLTVSGVYLWAVLKAERKGGLIFLGAGLFSFVLVVLALIA